MFGARKSPIPDLLAPNSQTHSGVMCAVSTPRYPLSTRQRVLASVPKNRLSPTFVRPHTYASFTLGLPVAHTPFASGFVIGWPMPLKHSSGCAFASSDEV